MAHYAKVTNGIVQQVIVAEAEFVENLVDNIAGRWVQTSYNGNFRKNYAGVGDTYDKTRDAFIAPKPRASWTLVEDTCQWKQPTDYPDDGKMYDWDEDTTSWKEIT